MLRGPQSQSLADMQGNALDLAIYTTDTSSILMRHGKHGCSLLSPMVCMPVAFGVLPVLIIDLKLGLGAMGLAMR